MEKKFRLLLLLALLLTAATGAWAQSTIHVVSQDNVNTIFSGDGYTLGEAVKAGDVLDFQGTIELEGDASHSLVINKLVNIISSTKDAVVKLHTVSGSLQGDDPGSSFVINKAGSGTTVQDIRIENTETWIFNTSNVTFTGVTMHVEDASVGTGVGHVSIRYSDHVTFDGCTVYTKNNGGSSCCVLSGSHDCTFKDTHFEAAGSVGNVLYIGNPYNIQDKPADYTMNNDNISVLNCTITAESSGATSNFLISGGLRHRIENCTVNFATNFGCAATASEDGHVIRNNTFTKGMNIPKYCTAEGNTVTVTGTGNMAINQGATANNNTITVTGTGKVNVNKGSTLTGNTINGNVTVTANSSDYIGSTITGNTINGTLTFASNSKNNTLTRNVITSTDDYAVVMASTADANNTVQYNTLIAATKKGDEAVNPSTGTGNTISNNSTIVLMMKEGTQDADKWTVKVGEGQAQALPIGGLKGDGSETVTLTYNGRLKVKGVKATSDAAPAVTYTLLSAATTADHGKVVCAAGHLHDAKTAVPAGCTAVGILGKVTETGHGLILALQDAKRNNWNTIKDWTSVTTYAGTTLKQLPDDVARGSLTSYTALGETAVSNWAVAQKSDYEAIFTNLGSTTGDSDGTTYDGNVNDYITTVVGGTAISGGYCSATDNGNNGAWLFLSEYWDSTEANSDHIRPVLGF